MVPKATAHLVRINSVSSIAANILKQEMLSLGGDVAVARDVLTGKTRKTDCLLMGNLSQFMRLDEKLNKQPFGLNGLAGELSCALTNYKKNNFRVNLGKYKLDLRKGRTYIMGVLNMTPDSFSADGLYPSTVNKIVDIVQKMVQDGADIIDVGGESSRPQAKPVPIKEELARTIPVIKALAKRIRVPISIDTYKPEVARRALDNGAVIVNDITGLRDPGMRREVSGYKAGVIIMHMQGNPRIMQKNPHYDSLIDEIIEYLDKAIERAVEAGIEREKIIIDPGIGFGKTLEHNLEILKRLKELKVLGRPVMVGPSRKSFIGKILNLAVQERIFGTVPACVLAVENGANIVRVHDVKEVKQALKITEAILNC
jgi:dihydropteroate synthase